MYELNLLQLSLLVFGTFLSGALAGLFAACLLFAARDPVAEL